MNTKWLWDHRTKVLGFTQITIAQVMLWDFISPGVGVALGSINGLLTVWVGFLNSQINQENPQ
jgi:hypothetical protein